MSFNNSGIVQHSFNNLGGNNFASFSNRSSTPKHIPLNASMIDRVYNAKPGCSACGKKVS